MFNNLSEKLDKAFHVLKGHGSITEINVAETLKEVRRALLDADVNFKIAKNFTNTVKEKAMGQDVLTTLNPSQLMVKIVKDELTKDIQEKKLRLAMAKEFDRLKDTAQIDNFLAGTSQTRKRPTARTATQPPAAPPVNR